MYATRRMPDEILIIMVVLVTFSYGVGTFAFTTVNIVDILWRVLIVALMITAYERHRTALCKN